MENADKTKTLKPSAVKLMEPAKKQFIKRGKINYPPLLHC
jgi:hypothetical protein